MRQGPKMLGIILLGTSAACAHTGSLFPQGGARSRGILGPTVAVTDTLEQGLSAWLSGSNVTKAFRPYTASARQGVVSRARQHGVRSARVLGMELELLYFKGAEPVYYLRTFVHPGPTGPAFLHFRGREPRRERGTGRRRLYVRGHPFSAFTGQSAGLAEAARGLARTLRAGRCSALWIARPLEFLEAIPEGLRRRLERGLGRTRRGLEEQCRRLSEVDADRIELRIDDFSALGLDADGKMAGLIRGELRLRTGGRIHVRMGSFRPVRRLR